MIQDFNKMDLMQKSKHYLYKDIVRNLKKDYHKSTDMGLSQIRLEQKYENFHYYY